MRLVFGLVLVLGVALAGGAMYMAKDRITQYQTVLANQQAALSQAVTTQDVFVANRPMRYGETLTRADVRPVPWPDNAIPAGAFTDPTELFPEEDDNPRVVLRAMERDEPILAVKVTAPGEDAGVASRLGKGMRAFAITVDVASGVSGFLRPGDRVDVYWTGEDRDGGFTRLIQANLPIIAIDQDDDEDRNRPTIARTVTVEAAPEQIARLAQAQASGRLALALVGVADDTVATEVVADRNALLGVQAQEAQREEEICTIRTRRGADIVMVPIPCTN